jgi:oxygen-independent coproporphyrinogen III oxidase
MAGIYLHVPFCRQACYYCDFHFSTNTTRKKEMVQAMMRELEIRKNYVHGEPIRTIYFGGGTPSLLSEKELGGLLEMAYKNFDILPKIEITLEANPDDINQENLIFWKNKGVNRLSIGIQSFHNPHLQHLHRVHTAEHAQDCVKLAQDIGFENITIDLIYGIPAENHTIWEQDIEKATALHVPHISAYCLTIEEQTVFGKWLKKKKINPIDDDFAATQFDLLLKKLGEAGFEQYEISNFSLPDWHSRHNSAYWFQVPYLGIGPGAHSYDGRSRQANISNNALYIKELEKGTVPAEPETLTKEDHINEYLLTTLRTKWGCDMDFLRNQYQFELAHAKRDVLEKFTRAGWVEQNGQKLFLTPVGKLLADTITSALFVD